MSATLYASGQRDIQTAQQAAQALRPLAGSGASLLFALGIIGTGLLGVPVLAGSAAYAIAEAGGWYGSTDGDDLLALRPFIYRGGWIVAPSDLRDQLLQVAQAAKHIDS